MGKFKIYLILFFFVPIVYASQSQEEIAAMHPSWLSLYQYKKNIFGNYKSEVISKQFFISTKGMSNPLVELIAADHEFSNPQNYFGTLKQLAPCAFPARKEVLEKLLNKKYPSVNCEDLNNWIGRINADRASILFAGAYSGNPASILGHTFLRFYNSQSNQSGNQLLSYTVGFSATTDPQDGKLTYAIKGVLGEYPGYYDIEPYFIKVGIYNNSESRDLWDYELQLSPAQVQFYLKYIWELTFNAQFRYYFFDLNCSYRLLSSLNVVLDRQDLTEDLAPVVIPSDTLHLLIHKKIISRQSDFRSSLKRKLSHKINLLDEETLVKYEKSKKSVEEVKSVTDPTALDALMDYWLMKNYERKTKLSSEEKVIFNETFSQAARVEQKTKFNLLDSDIQKMDGLNPPTEGHSSSWITYSLYEAKGERGHQFEYKMGVHPYFQRELGYDGVAAIEYLGLSLDQTPQKDVLWNFLILKALSLENTTITNRVPSWKFDFGLSNSNQFEIRKDNQFYLNGGVGLAKKNHSFEIYSFAQLNNINHLTNHIESFIYPSLSLGFKFKASFMTLLSETQFFQVNQQNKSVNQTQLTFFIDKDFLLGLTTNNPSLFISYFF